MNLHKNLSEWLTILGTFVFLSICFISISIIFSNPWYRSDFLSFYSSAHIWTTNPHQLYDLLFQHTVQLNFMGSGNIYFYPYIYLPVLLIPLQLLLFLPPQYIYVGTVLMQIILFAFSIYMLFRTFRISIRGNLLLLSMLASFAPVFVTLFNTQLSVFLLCIYIFILKFFREKKFVLVGIATSFLLYKPQFLILPLIALFVLRNRNILKGLCVGLSVHMLVNTIVLGDTIGQFVMSNIWYMTEFESKMEQATLMVSLQSIVSTLLFFLSKPVLYTISILLAGVCASIIVMYLKSKNVFTKNPTIGIILLILGSLISGVHVHTHDAILLILPIVYISMTDMKFVRKFLLLAGIYISFFLTSPLSPYTIYLLQPVMILIVCVYFFRNNMRSVI